ncbi:SAM-dependent methyltransferase [Thermobifida halotolerans]|uniref:SAM-dependent methyltransferase n=1 Tax=Thermobifida halotolerans TaxID=483545 RepID=A0A399G4B2_9ACTN|nr:SAM-dependent methyltransferase [Thermobifida halotolerans]
MPDIDLSVPTVARTYDALLGGKDNFEADRIAAQIIESVNPGSKTLIRQNRRYLTRAVDHVAGALGIDQFLDLGSGLPTMENTHQIAQRRVPEARVVYVDIDPIVLTHSRALLVDNPHTGVAVGDARHVTEVLTSPEVTRLLDFDRPVCLMLVSLLHCVSDADDPWGLVRRYFDRFAPGSVLILSHLASDDAAAARRLGDHIRELGMDWGYIRRPEEVERLFDGLALVSPAVDDSAAPMLVDCEGWRNGNVPPTPRPADPDQKIWEHAGVGVKP